MRGVLAGWLGNRGERLAARYLRRQGFRILARQFTNSFGEIDIIALDGDCVVFVEVKTRKSTDTGLPFEAVTSAKQKKITQVALAYLKRSGWLERSARFDVVSIVWPDGRGQPRLEHFPHAFEGAGRGQMYS